jgi:hypothetical protein
VIFSCQGTEKATEKHLIVCCFVTDFFITAFYNREGRPEQTENPDLPGCLLPVLRYD